MSSETIPEWAEKAAFEVQIAAISECKDQHLGANYDYPFVTGAAKEVLDRHIAHALLAAEQRGLEKAADKAFEIMEGRLRQKAAYEVVGQKREARDFETMAIEGNYIAAAIRSLGEKT